MLYALSVHLSQSQSVSGKEAVLANRVHEVRNSFSVKKKLTMPAGILRAGFPDVQDYSVFGIFIFQLLAAKVTFTPVIQVGCLK
jgi:hypothetical protein